MTTRRQQCTAHRSDRSGRRCRRWAMDGQQTCQVHGGASPQAKRSARERLLEAADPAAARLVRAIEDADPKVAITACRLVLDRAGHGPTSTLELAALDREQAERIAAVIGGALQRLGLDGRDAAIRAAVAAELRGEPAPKTPRRGVIL